MAEIVWLLEETVRAVHSRQISEHGGRPGIRDEGLLLSALARPQNLAAYGDPRTMGWWETRPEAWEACRRNPRPRVYSAVAPPHWVIPGWSVERIFWRFPVAVVLLSVLLSRFGLIGARLPAPPLTSRNSVWLFSGFGAVIQFPPPGCFAFESQT